MTDLTINAIFPENKEVLTPKANTFFNDNLLTHVPTIPITKGEEDKNGDVGRTISQTAIAPLTSLAVSEGGNSFVNEDTKPETSSATAFH